VLAQQTLAVTERASAMAQKGMLFAAQEELVQALQLVAQSQDQVQGTTWRTAALAAGWTALDEANDFTSQAGRAGGPNVGEIIKSHRTTILQVAGEVPPAVAQQYYVGYAQQQLALAVGGEPAASQALHVLGKVHVALAGSAGQSQPLHTQRAMAIHQAALAVDPRNYQAANELGVLLASTGELAEAKRALLHSISIHPHAATWHNLATVHRRLGEAELAAMAENERRMMVAKSPAAPASPQAVTWVDAAAFAAAGRTESSGARVAGSAPALSASQSQRR
jgi:tetratricopeptide (TPR) repeat protein